MAITTSSLTAYVNENSAPITKSLMFGAPSVKLMSVMSDVKGDSMLNVLKTDIVFGDGETCGFDDDSTATLTQRKLETANLKVNLAYCQRSLSKYWAGQELNQKIGIETLPFEEKFVDDAVSNVNKSIDKMIWYGDSSSVSAIEFDGLMTIAATDAAEVSPTVNVVAATSALDAALYSKLQAVVAAIPAEVYGDNIVCMSVSTFRAVVADFEANNPYHTLEFVTDDKLCFKMPNSNILVYGVQGMEKANSTDMISFNPNNTFFGCDYEDAMETFKFRFDEHFDQFELHMLMNAGVQFAFLDEVVYAGTYVATI